MCQCDFSDPRQANALHNSFNRDGYVVVPSFFSKDVLGPHITLVSDNLDPLVGPVEFESDVGYPGAPTSRTSRGGATPRRLLNAIQRGDLADLATHGSVKLVLSSLLKTDRLFVSQNHHNCVMTKYPGFSSSTQWHQDIRYWSFERPELISMWVALGRENEENGALRVIPGSHRLEFQREQFDSELFFRKDNEKNIKLLSSEKVVRLEPGDVLFFHSRLLHAANKNTTKKIKLSVVYTYYSADNPPIAGTRSATHAPVGVI